MVGSIYATSIKSGVTWIETWRNGRLRLKQRLKQRQAEAETHDE